jgi:glutamyl-tRNA reductase
LYGNLIEQWRRRDTALLQAGFAEGGPPVPLSEEERQRQEGLIEERLRARAAADEKRKQEVAEEVAAKKRRREERQARELERHWKYRKKESEPGDLQRKISKRSLSEVREIIKDVVVDGNRELVLAIFADIAEGDFRIAPP